MDCKTLPELQFLERILAVKNRVRILCPAKINLFLKVLRQRKDGFHQIFSWMQAVDLQDELEIKRIEKGIKISCDDPCVPADKTNLAYRAAELFLRRTKIKAGVKIKIMKRIPVAGGLGGGSSNAAAVILGLQKSFKVKLTKTQMLSIAEKIGSDVPFFFTSGSAVASGRGEKLKNIKLPLNYWLVLINPGFEVSTKWAYSKVKPKPLKRKLLPSRSRVTLNLMLKEIKVWGNDLQGVVCKRYPEIKTVIGKLNQSGALYSAMSGSGPTVFGIFPDKNKAKTAAEKLAWRRDWKTWVVRPIKLWPQGLP